MMYAEILVLDIGTGATKVECFDSEGTVLERSIAEYGEVDPGSDEIDPEVWYTAVAKALSTLRDNSEISLERVRSVVLSGQMQDVIPVGNGGATAPAILYFGHRESSAYTEWLSRIGADRVREITYNNPDTAGFPAKLLSLDGTNPALVSETEYILCGAHDYVAYRLTGVAATDPTTASTTGLFDPVRGVWAEEILDTLGEWSTRVPVVHRGDEVDGVLLPDIADSLGLPRTTQVVHGAGDVGSSVRAMELEGFSSSLYLGTSGWILNVADLDQPGDPSHGVYNLRHPSDAKLIRVAPVLTAAGAFDWFVDHALGTEADDRNTVFRRLAHHAAELDPRSTHVLFLPYLVGERSPFQDPDATGMFVGIRKETEQSALFRAVEEGVAFSLRSIFEALYGDQHAESIDTIQVTGGGTNVEGFPQVIADVLGRELAIAEEARFSGTQALRAFVSKPNSATSVYNRIVPSEKREIYQRKYRLFQRAYQVNRELMAALRDIS